MNVYIPILVLGAIGAAFAVGSVAIASLVGPSRYNKSKLAAYECGIEPTESPVSGPGATAGQRFPVKYYLTAILFIVFDIEIVFLYPWAVSYDALGTFALVEMVVVILTVVVAYAYVWRRGGLTWDGGKPWAWKNSCPVAFCCQPSRRLRATSARTPCGRRRSGWPAARSR